jgi:hypothetical protein
MADLQQLTQLTWSACSTASDDQRRRQPKRKLAEAVIRDRKLRPPGLARSGRLHDRSLGPWLPR